MRCGSLGSNKADPCRGDNEQDSAVMAMALSVYEGMSARGDSQLAWRVRGSGKGLVC